MDFETGRAVLGGLVGVIAMTVAMTMGSAMMGIKMDMPMTLGTMVFPKGTTAWVAGLMMHVVMGIVLFLIYAGLIDAFGIETTVAGWAGLFGVVHAMAAGAAFGMMPMVHPRMAADGVGGGTTVPAPGFFGVRLGATAPMAIVAVHAVFGLVGGAVYAA